MVNSPAPALLLWEGGRDELLSWTRSTMSRAGLAARARIVLLASEDMANSRIAAEVGTTTTSVWKWRSRYVEAGLAGLSDAPRSGRPKLIDDEQIITATLQPPSRKYGMTHWSSRLLGSHLQIGNATVAMAWRMYGAQPWKSETFKFSTDPELVGKVTEVVGLYLAPRRTRSCCVWTRRVRSRRWTGLRRCCRCGSGMRRNARTITSGMERRRWSPRSRSRRACHRGGQAQASPAGVPELSAVARPRLPGARSASGDGQLRHTQDPRGEGLAV